jgi:hypothetical protein
MLTPGFSFQVSGASVQGELLAGLPAADLIDQVLEDKFIKL